MPALFIPSTSNTPRLVQKIKTSEFEYDGLVSIHLLRENGEPEVIFIDHFFTEFLDYPPGSEYKAECDCPEPIELSFKGELLKFECAFCEGGKLTYKVGKTKIATPNELLQPLASDEWQGVLDMLQAAFEKPLPDFVAISDLIPKETA